MKTEEMVERNNLDSNGKEGKQEKTVNQETDRQGREQEHDIK